MDKSSDTGGRVTLKRAIAVSDAVTIERIVGGRTREWRDGAYAKRRRVVGVVSDDGG